jgi:hypothetical protein
MDHKQILKDLVAFYHDRSGTELSTIADNYTEMLGTEFTDGPRRIALGNFLESVDAIYTDHAKGDGDRAIIYGVSGALGLAGAALLVDDPRNNIIKVIISGVAGAVGGMIGAGSIDHYLGLVRPIGKTVGQYENILDGIYEREILGGTFPDPSDLTQETSVGADIRALPEDTGAPSLDGIMDEVPEKVER